MDPASLSTARKSGPRSWWSATGPGHPCASPRAWAPSIWARAAFPAASAAALAVALAVALAAAQAASPAHAFAAGGRKPSVRPPAPPAAPAPLAARPLTTVDLRLSTGGGRLQADATLVFAPGAGERAFLIGSRYAIEAVTCGGGPVEWRAVDAAAAVGLFGESLVSSVAAAGADSTRPDSAEADSAWAEAVRVVALAVPAKADASADTVQVRYGGPLPDPGPWALRLRPGDLFHPLSPGAAVRWRLRLPELAPARIAGPAPAVADPAGGAALTPPRPLPAFALYATRADTVPWRRVGDLPVACLAAGGGAAPPEAWARLEHALAVATADWGAYPWPCLAAVWDGAQGSRPHGLAGLITNLPSEDGGEETTATATLLHEVLHGWFGLGVPTDPERGDWSEGLCALLADHDLRALHDPRWGEQLRREVLRQYAAVAGTAADVPLARWRPESGSPAVGYGKGLFFWLTLRHWLGDGVFRSALRAFIAARLDRPTGWAPLRDAFLDQVEERQRVAVTEFFAAWLERPGAPRVSVTAAEWRPLAREARVVLRQDGPEGRAEPGARSAPWPLWITIRFEGLSKPPFTGLLRDEEQVFRCPVPLQASTVTVDPAAETFRLVDSDAPLTATVRLAAR